MAIFCGRAFGKPWATQKVCHNFEYSCLMMFTFSSFLPFIHCFLPSFRSEKRVFGNFPNPYPSILPIIYSNPAFSSLAASDNSQFEQTPPVADIVKMIDSQPDLASMIRRVRGGYLKIQGTWMPYEVALRLSRRVAWPIRDDLVPLFG